jgi:hypothetical protein
VVRERVARRAERLEKGDEAKPLLALALHDAPLEIGNAVFPADPVDPLALPQASSLDHVFTPLPGSRGQLAGVWGTVADLTSARKA